MGILSWLFGKREKTTLRQPPHARDVPDRGWKSVGEPFKAHYIIVERRPPDVVDPRALCGVEAGDYASYLHYYCPKPPDADCCNRCLSKVNKGDFAVKPRY